MFHQNMTIKLWLVIWLTFIGLYFVLPQTELFEQENFVLPIIENSPDATQASRNIDNTAATQPRQGRSSAAAASTMSSNREDAQQSNEVVDYQIPDRQNQHTDAVGTMDEYSALTSASSDQYIQNANLPYIPDLEIGVTEREQVLNTLGQPARQLQQGKVLEYYFQQHSEQLQVLSEEESNLLLQNEIAPQSHMYHLMIEFDINNVIMAMNMQPL